MGLGNTRKRYAVYIKLRLAKADEVTEWTDSRLQAEALAQSALASASTEYAGFRDTWRPGSDTRLVRNGLPFSPSGVMA